MLSHGSRVLPAQSKAELVQTWTIAATNDNNPPSFCQNIGTQKYESAWQHDKLLLNIHSS